MSHGPRRARGSKAQPSYHLLCSAQRMHSVQSDPPHDRPTDWVIDWHALSELSNIGAQIDDRSVVQADRPTEHDFSVRGVQQQQWEREEKKSLMIDETCVSLRCWAQSLGGLVWCQDTSVATSSAVSRLRDHMSPPKAPHSSTTTDDDDDADDQQSHMQTSSRKQDRSNVIVLQNLLQHE
ncbi:hypothetical protein AXG93_3817s1210 [Marchantia polymorpha subsp. ruderalis]|uniref:Uncharacterized protein n=1 Tax=Marchantia polymorpha subsp. ruderalis TaxID=1480154 RepID=A0A176W0F2_MARPO|nr:hypothetical protein AXG93_3817s1210 [Marchantia polymorpha subsp. ruderalis]